MELGSKAERLVLSFPAIAANYPKAIDQLKERFGQEDLLVQIYVRDLLTLVMKNAATGRAKADLPLLYDELEIKLRSLESLGKTQDKYGDFLTPLVESCLPEEVLVAWERSRNHQTESEGYRSLEQLMNFLRQEVKGEEMVFFGTDRPHHPPESTKKGLSCNTGNSVKLESGLTAVETKLGWTVFGKGSCVKDNIVTTLSMHSMNIPVNKLWELEVLGISSPTEIEKQKTELSLNDFNNKMKKFFLMEELIPDILDRFRMYPIGISADIEGFLNAVCSTERREIS
ncbi:uncharacterized protein TNCV_1886451 [Trichonephila clavipes]|nr:uncharacterized protein TNCV_1886451 [Trichonephila clavipes]